LLEGGAKQDSERMNMAADGDLDKETAVHRQGYERFISWFKTGTVICLIIAAIVILIIRK
jgi:hypothetical protein